jgi:hypothetical protein
MHHLDEGTLRRSIDEPLALAPRALAHVKACAVCAARRDTMAAAADSVAAAFAQELPQSDPRQAFSELRRRLELRANPLTVWERLSDFSAWRLRGYAKGLGAAAAVAIAVLLFVFTPVGTLAQNFLTIFEPRQFVAVPVSRNEFRFLPNLNAFGTVTDRAKPQRRDVNGPAQAQALTGIPVRLPRWVPPAVPRNVRYAAVSRGSASFTFSAAKARAYASSAHRAMPPMPARLDGSTLTLEAGPMVVIAYGAGADFKAVRERDDERLPPLVIVEAVAPRVTSTRATAREIESYLLEMPGVTPALAQQIRAIGDPSTTVPIPVPIDKAFAQDVVVDGARGLAVGDETGVGGGIVWQKYGIVYGVGGALPQRQLMEIAQSL